MGDCAAFTASSTKIRLGRSYVSKDTATGLTGQADPLYSADQSKGFALLKGMGSKSVISAQELRDLVEQNPPLQSMAQRWTNQGAKDVMRYYRRTEAWLGQGNEFRVKFQRSGLQSVNEEPGEPSREEQKEGDDSSDSDLFALGLDEKLKAKLPSASVRRKVDAPGKESCKAG